MKSERCSSRKELFFKCDTYSSECRSAFPLVFCMWAPACVRVHTVCVTYDLILKIKQKKT